MKEKPIKVLLVDGDLDDIALLEEALTEIEESLYIREWMQACALIPVDRAAEAIEVLAEEPVDIILLDPNLPDGRGVDAFRRIQAAAPQTPIVILAATDDEPHAVSLVRQGAQDYLVKSEIDCTILIRSLRCSVERHRVRSALQSLTFLDDLTGLYSRGGFDNLAERHSKLARQTGRDLRLYLVDLDGLEAIHDTFGSQEKDMALILISDILRDLFDDTDVIGRPESTRFAVVAMENGTGDPGALIEDLKLRIDQANSRRGGRCPLSVTIGAARLTPDTDTAIEQLQRAAESSLCENRRSKAKTTT